MKAVKNSVFRHFSAFCRKVENWRLVCKTKTRVLVFSPFSWICLFWQNPEKGRLQKPRLGLGGPIFTLPPLW